MSNTIEHYALIGYPISHSLSPKIYQHFAQETKQSIHYHTISATSETFFSTAHAFLQQGKGLNITAPFKQLGLKLAQTLHPRAQEARATNLILKKEDGTLVADNTDGIGLITDLKINHSFDVRDKKILILGAGGAARGIIPELMHQAPKHIILANRDYEKAQQLAEPFKLRAESLEALNTYSFDLILQASTELPQLPVNFKAGEAFCYDLNYGKRALPFKAWAEQQGAIGYTDGLGMLVEQAAAAFYVWRGIKPKTSELIHTLRKTL